MPVDARRNALALEAVRCWTDGRTCGDDWSQDDLDQVWSVLLAHHVEAILLPVLPVRLLRPHHHAAVEAARHRTSLLLMELERILPVVRRAGVDPVVLKGAGLALSAYDDPLQRWFVDLDLLVAPEEVEPACAALAAAGYRPFEGHGGWAYYDEHHLHRILIGPARSVVEVHWALTLPQSAYRHDAGGVLRRARSVPLGGGSCRVASAADQMLHGVYQNIADGFLDLRRALDYVRLQRQMGPADWDEVVALTHAGGMDRPVGFSLHFMKDITGVAPGRVPEPSQPIGPLTGRLLSNLDVVAGCIERKALSRIDYDHFLHLLLLPTARLRLRDLGRLLSGAGAAAEAHGHRSPGLGPRRLRTAFYHLRGLTAMTLRSLGAIAD